MPFSSFSSPFFKKGCFSSFSSPVSHPVKGSIELRELNLTVWCTRENFLSCRNKAFFVRSEKYPVVTLRDLFVQIFSQENLFILILRFRIYCYIEKKVLKNKCRINTSIAEITSSLSTQYTLDINTLTNIPK